ncbi:hypothetical protein [Listeria monocytogenes]|uniref:hypothetical protein n=1 Tax=Listeria monocytogenes TaxID=1639 RepID=UPI000737BBF4|nr:hypothetical protein [Listeria monocytogenes]EAD2079582.1 SAM--benzoic acid carboxyl methyltransferase [Listeria monocytogenes]EAH1841806.1 SAM--benzoic acid carboxyl methyltransferase [Listeria monocytogenes]ECW2836841.1 SAM--benzoic acid carboxyl methyltransferase [Listeria monocytogenes]EGT2128140.1 SAM--benzoic acid carboxyl methyltransferase [Listeria monocytogenes]EIC0890901.1 SAM--benzoic acid carboxyl methyltransferase [Listeria monocytogenes]
MNEDYDRPECFECDDGECSYDDKHNLVCEECGHVYTQGEWDEKNNKEIENYFAFIKKINPEYFD